MGWRIHLIVAVCVLLSLGRTAAAQDVAPNLTLPPETRQFLAAHPTIRVRLHSAWPPLLFAENGAPSGIAVDYMRLAAAKLGLTIEPSEPMGWPDLLRRLPTGDGVDVQPTMRATEHRRANILFTRPFTSFPVIIVTRSDSPFVGDLDDLAGRVVVAERSYWYTEELAARHPAILLREVTSSDDGLRMVAQGDADAYVGVLPVATWHMEHRGYTNLKLAAPAGLSPAELSFGVRGDWPHLAAALDAALAAITPQEHRQIREKWLNIPTEFGIAPRTAALWGGGGLAVAVLVVGSFAMANRRLLREIGLRRQAEEQLRTSEATSRQLLDASSDACMLFDADGIMLGCNQVFATRFAIDPAAVPGTSLWDYFPPDVSAQRRVVVAQVVRTGVPVVTTDQRGERILSNSIYPLKDDAGVVRRVAVYSRDITEQVRAEERIASYVAEIERSNEDLEQFAYVASHDLREPLRQVASYVALLERRYGTRLDDDAREFIAFAKDGVGRMDQLILDLLDYSRIGRGETPAPTASDAALRVAMDNLKTVVAESGGAIDAPGPFPPVLACEPQLIRLFQNLIGNAIKYQRPQVTPKITVSATENGDMVEFAIADNGIGIDAEYHDRIFGIFQRLHGRTQYPGTGIGLAVCRKVVERHGGQIWVESVPGQGSTFRFTLKRSPAPPSR